jgi:site-specific DNA recombinase
VFDAAQGVARDHSYFSPRRTGPDHWLLRRLVVCGHCGIKAYCQGRRPAAQGELRYYVCNRRRALEAGGLERACPQPSTRAEALDSLVWEHLRQALLRPQLLVKGQAALGARSQQPDDELLRAQLERLERRLQGTDTEKRRLVDLYQMQAIELAEFQARQQEVISRHRQFEQEREALLAQHHELAINNRLSRKVESFARRIRDSIDALSFEQRQQLVRLLVEQVRVTGPQAQIHLRIPLDEPSPDEDIPSHANSARPAPHQASNQLRLRSLGGGLVFDLESQMSPPSGLPGCHHRH